MHDVSDDWDEDELSDGQINLLLRQAEQRLLNIEPSKEQITTTTAPAQKCGLLASLSLGQLSQN